MTEWTPTGVALVIAAIGGLITAITTGVVNVVGLIRLNTKIDGMLVDRDKAKVKEGEQKQKIVGEEKAAILAQGQSEGRDSERAAARLGPPATADQPLPVADDRTATAAERSATATERVATATEDSKQR